MTPLKRNKTPSLHLYCNPNPLLENTSEVGGSELGPMVKGEGALQGLDDPQFIRQPVKASA